VALGHKKVGCPWLRGITDVCPRHFAESINAPCGQKCGSFFTVKEYMYCKLVLDEFKRLIPVEFLPLERVNI
jgi:hypothetical protein